MAKKVEEKVTMTGAELTAALTSQNETFTRTNAARERQMAYIANIPASRDKVNESNGEVITISREQELRNMARTDAINVMTKGEFKRNLSLAADFAKKAKIAPLSEDDQKAQAHTSDRIKVMNKLANHPEKASEMKRLQEYTYSRNCTEEGIKGTIKEFNDKIAANKELIPKLKGSEQDSFTVPRSLAAVHTDETFNRQLLTSIANRPAPVQAVEPKVARGKTATTTKTAEKTKEGTKKRGGQGVAM